MRAKNCPPLRNRFYAKTRRDESGCLIWTGGRSTGGMGYGSFTLNGRSVAAHRAAWLLEMGSIPDGYHIDHLCRVPLCVAVEHLEPVPPRTNWERGTSRTLLNALKTQCPQGHPYDDENTYIERGRGRQCRTCRRIRAAEYNRQKRRALRALALGDTP